MAPKLRREMEREKKKSTKESDGPSVLCLTHILHVHVQAYRSDQLLGVIVLVRLE